MAWSWTSEYKTKHGEPTWSLIKGPYGFGILSCDGLDNSPSAIDRDLIQSAPELDEAVDELLGLIAATQRLLVDRIVPGNQMSDKDCINAMLGLLDGPEWRRVAALRVVQAKVEEPAL